MSLTVSLESRQQVYLLGKIRHDIVTRRRYLTRFTGRPGMTEAEVQEMLARRRSELKFRENLYLDLGGNPDDLTLEAEQS